MFSERPATAFSSVGTNVLRLIILNHIHTMNKKWLALAAAGAAYYLFNTKKGNEVRQTAAKKAQGLGSKLKDQYDQYRNQSESKVDNSMA